MMIDLKQQLRDLYSDRLIKYSNTAYQQISNDWNFENVPDELLEIWCGRAPYSFHALSIACDSDIDKMSYDELVYRINAEQSLANCLRELFAGYKNNDQFSLR